LLDDSADGHGPDPLRASDGPDAIPTSASVHDGGFDLWRSDGVVLHPTLGDHVVGVVTSLTQEQVVWADTNSVVAVVEHHRSEWDGAVSHDP
jgi:hypothetical protein